MKTSTSLTTISLAALLSSLGLFACGGGEVPPADQAQTARLARPASDNTAAPEAMHSEGREHQRGRSGERHRGGEHHRGPPSPEKLLERFDANGNGTLEASELPERMQEHIGDIDTNGDAVVSKDELAAHFKAKFAEHAKERFNRQDTNHDGVLDAAELGSKRWAHLSVADQNGDQKLTADELRAAFESGKLKRPGHERGEREQRGQHQAPAAPAR